MVGPVNEAAEAHKEPRHQGEHAEKAQHDGLHQNYAQVPADAELHEAHGSQTGDGGERAAGDLRDGLAQGGHHGLPGLQALPLLGVAVAEDNGIVDGQGQLEHHGHGVGDEGDLPEEEVGPLVHQRRHAEGENHHRDLHIGLGGEEQHQEDDHHGDDHDHLHLGGQAVGGGVAGVTGDVDIVALQEGFDLLQGRQAHWVLGGAVVGDGKQGRAVLVVVRAVVEGHGLYPFDLLHLL